MPPKDVDRLGGFLRPRASESEDFERPGGRLPGLPERARESALSLDSSRFGLRSLLRLRLKGVFSLPERARERALSLDSSRFGRRSLLLLLLKASFWLFDFTRVTPRLGLLVLDVRLPSMVALRFVILSIV